MINAKSVHELSYEEIEKSFKINTISHAFIMSRILDHMYKNNIDGQIVTIASIASFISGAKNSDYAGSKFALRGFHEAMRMEIKKRKSKISTTIIHPYIINTELFKGISSNLKWYFSIYLLQKQG